MTKDHGFDLKHCSVKDLMVMLKDCSKYKEDKEFREAILTELKTRKQLMEFY